jgi:hypothetical protein
MFESSEMQGVDGMASQPALPRRSLAAAGRKVVSSYFQPELDFGIPSKSEWYHILIAI